MNPVSTIAIRPQDPLGSNTTLILLVLLCQLTQIKMESKDFFLGLDFDLNAEFDDPARRDAEVIAGAAGVAGQERKQRPPPAHGL